MPWTSTLATVSRGACWYGLCNEGEPAPCGSVHVLYQGEQALLNRAVVFIENPGDGIAEVQTDGVFEFWPGSAYNLGFDYARGRYSCYSNPVFGRVTCVNQDHGYRYDFIDLRGLLARTVRVYVGWCADKSRSIKFGAAVWMSVKSSPLAYLPGMTYEEWRGAYSDIVDFVSSGVVPIKVDINRAVAAFRARDRWCIVSESGRVIEAVGLSEEECLRAAMLGSHQGSPTA